MVAIVECHEGKAALCREVLDDLPEWFGLAKAKANYIAASAELPMLAGLVDGQAVGFVSLKLQTDFAVELYVLGVRARIPPPRDRQRPHRERRAICERPGGGAF